jgi:hypothetical protein
MTVREAWASSRSSTRRQRSLSLQRAGLGATPSSYARLLTAPHATNTLQSSLSSIRTACFPPASSPPANLDRSAITQLFLRNTSDVLSAYISGVVCEMHDKHIVNRGTCRKWSGETKASESPRSLGSSSCFLYRCSPRQLRRSSRFFLPVRYRPYK